MSAKENYKAVENRQATTLADQYRSLDQINEIYEALDEELDQLAENDCAALRAGRATQDLPAYDSATALNEQASELAAKKTPILQKINPQSVSHPDDLLRACDNSNSAEGIGAALELPADSVNSDRVADENILQHSTWVSVSEQEQWHVKVFQPNVPTPLATDLAADDSSGNLDELLSRSLAAMSQVIEDMQKHTVLMLPGEFATGRCFYGSKRSENGAVGNGLAWTMARAGYQVFVVDHSVGQLKVTAEAAPGNWLEKLLPMRFLRGFKQRLVAGAEKSELVRTHLPTVMAACADKIQRHSEAAFLEHLRSLSIVLANADLTQQRKERLFAQINELQQSLLCCKENIRCPAVWVGHGFSSALLAATYARMGLTADAVRRCVFFAGRRQWVGGGHYSKALRKLLTSPLTQVVVKLTNVFPAKTLGLGPANTDALQFQLYGAWIARKEWQDPVDDFDYRLALSNNATPPTLHVMNEDDDGLVSAQDVRRFANELNSTRANLIGIPGSLRVPDPSEASALSSGDLTPPVFTHAGLLTEPAAETWLFNPVLDWLDESGSQSDSLLPSQPASRPVASQDSDYTESAYLGRLVPGLG